MATEKTITVRLFVDEEIEEWDGEELRFYKLKNKFELVDTDIPQQHLPGVAESWAQSDHYYEVIQNTLGCFSSGRFER